MIAALIAASLLQDPIPAHEIHFKSHDGYEMFGKLVRPSAAGRYPVVVYVQTAEGMTVDMKRPLGGGRTFNYFDLYRKKLPEMGVAFFSYEGRGVSMGDQPPRYEKIDRAAFDTSTLSNKVLDCISAIAAVRSRSDVDPSRIYLMGASEGTLLAAEVASTVPDLVAGLVLYGVLTSNMRYNFAYIMTDGAFLVYLDAFDANKDGLITKSEFENDPKKYRANALRGAGFEVFDQDGDGSFTVEEMKKLTKPYLDALENENFEALDAWGRTAAAVALPKDWFKDHFAHPTIWSFLSNLDVPVGCFQGALDSSVPISGVKLMEKKAVAAGKKKMEFHYFDDLEHTLGIGRYFVDGTVPAGHTAIFEFIRKGMGSGE